MFIARNTLNIPAPFGGAELQFAGTHLVSVRPSERRLEVIGRPVL